MSLKCALCSDIDLGYKFKHMTSKQALSYEKRQLEHFDRLVNILIDEKVDIFVIAGNLYGVSKPKNQTIRIVNESLTRLSDSGIITLILPGSRDTPLYFSNDHPVHFIFQNIKNVYILQNADYSINIRKEITTLVFQNEIKGVPIQIFTTTSPFIRPSELDFNLQINEGYNTWFLFSDIHSFKANLEQELDALIDKLNQCNIDSLLIGGILPYSPKKSDLKFNLIPCPQFHQNHFDYTDQEAGLSIYSFDKGEFHLSGNSMKMSDFKLNHKQIDVSPLSINTINEEIEEVIKEGHDQKNKIYKITLFGKIDKNDYQKISIFDLIDKGKRLNYYFELHDLIEFNSEAPAVEGLIMLTELENFTNILISEIQDKTDLDDNQKSEEIFYLREAMNLIKKDWRS